LESNLSKAEFCRLNKIAHSTIYKWLKRYGKEVASAMGLSCVDLATKENSNSQTLTSEQKFNIVLETANLQDLQKGEYCRMNDLSLAQLNKWTSNCMSANKEQTLSEHEQNQLLKTKLTQQSEELKALKKSFLALDKENERLKEALAEYAVKEIFVKKAQTLFEEE
jgi:transposase-like protein